jgi:uncharacterized protein YecE (DUF72 family)
MASAYFIGTSGWHYDHWRGRFYPDKLGRSEWLDYYARHFRTVELNNTFYRLPSESTFASWYSKSIPNFIFAVKVSRFITHVKRLKDCGEPLTTFLDRAGILKEKLGPLLYQLPPGMHRDDSTLKAFLTILPAGLKHVFEFRHESWLDEGIFKLLGRYGAGLCVFDMPDFKCPLMATADFAYVRFHGSAGLYESCYSDTELADWAERIKNLEVSEVYIYFNNDAEGYALDNARTIERYLAQEKEI